MPQQPANLNTLYRKISDTVRHVGVLVKPDGKVLSHYCDTRLFIDAERKNPSWLCGIYDYNVLPEHIQEDVDYMGGYLE